MRGNVGGPSAGPENDTRPTEDTFRLWWRALSFVSMVERLVHSRLHADFDVTLLRFYVMVALYGAPESLSMGVVSRRLIVSNGNVGGTVERLGSEGLVRR